MRKTVKFNLRELPKAVQFALAEQCKVMDPCRPIIQGPDSLPFVAFHQPYKIVVK